jgi:myo-inositol-1(or 4)-monophosphatase
MSNNICTDIKDIIVNNLDKIIELRSQKKLKPDGSYVSEGDLLCEKLIKEYLKEKHPDYSLVSEESPEQNIRNIQNERVVILDPIDGTENFVSGLKEWGVAVCVYENGSHSESMLALPELNEYLLTGEKISKFESRICGLSSSLTKEDLLNLEDGFEYRIIGCCVYNMFNVIRGAYSVFENPKGAWIWDIIPGLNLALEHNLNVIVNGREYNGKLLEPDKKYRFRISNQ